MLRRCAPATLVPFLLAACPGGEEPTPDVIDVSTAAAELCVLYTVGDGNSFQSILHGMSRCSAEESFLDPTTAQLEEIEESCVAGNQFYDIFVTALEGGRVDIDLEKTRACVEKGRAARGSSTIFAYNSGTGSLNALFDDADCTGALTPKVAEGGECRQDWDCTGDLACVADPPDSPTLRCLAPAEEGQLCGGTRRCDADLECTSEGTCAPAIAVGADCVNDPLGRGSCAVGAYCDGDGTGLCQPFLAQGDACTDASQCGELDCSFTTETCEPFAAPVAEGAACDEESFCAQYCSVCRAASAGAAPTCLDRGGLGDYCEDDDHCRNGYLCNPVAAACEAEPEADPLPGLGESCDVEAGCDEGFCGAGTCVAGVQNDPCDIDYLECASGFLCQVTAGAGRCVAEPAVGEECIDDTCGADAYCNAAGQCEVLRGAGASCEATNQGVECLSGTCLPSGTCATPGPSCYETRGQFLEYIILAFLLPLARLRRRRGR
ncbi:MAG: hypothetical protein ACO3JL_02365 [Myxococcota bacterium]